MSKHRGTDPEAIRVAEKLGLAFDGMQFDFYQFTVVEGPEEAKGITFYVKGLTQVSPRLYEKLREFGILDAWRQSYYDRGELPPGEGRMIEVPLRVEEAPEGTKWRIRSEVTSASKRQINGSIIALNERGTPIGALHYQQFEDLVLIGWIGVTEDYRRKGVATQLYIALQKEWPNKKITWGTTTPEGTALRESIERGLLP